ncbi:MAG: 2-hydroxyacyl-CoA dehydratase subunit D [Coriobacteriales bacterium]|jgi:benzoyl-CoA reductase/2-hydroxyglutaryl-CoA dehydratase subunit BcrC/BadD/HgdB
MEVARTYGGFVKRRLETDPAKAASLIRFGLHAESFRTGHLPDKEMPNAYRYLNHMAIAEVTEALEHPESFVWGNIFAPVEIFQALGLSCVSVECMSSYLSGFWIEDSLVDACEAAGFPATLCSYHKAFLGAAVDGILPTPAAAVTTSMICDANFNTFRAVGQMCGVPTVFLDVPYRWNEENRDYLVGQLESLVSRLEALTEKRLDRDALSEALVRENKSKEHYWSFLQKRKKHAYPETLTLRLFTIFATHLSVGSPWALKFFEMLDSEIDEYPADEAKRIFWVHLTPYAEPSLSAAFNYSDRIGIVADDLNLDYMEPLDADHPFEALAKKMICNIYNGGFERKVDAIARYVREFECEGAIEFCHWGCKQSCGGVQLIKERLREIGVPLLAIDGDGVDRRNNQDGQIKTRLEAFLELLDREESSEGQGDSRIVRESVSA